MNISQPITTVCLGGPLDGSEVTMSSEKEEIIHLVEVGGSELLAGDSLTNADAEFTEDRYQIIRFSIACSLGSVWIYRAWLHESFFPITPEVFRCVMMFIAPEEYQIDEFGKTIAVSSEKVFQYEGTVPSRN